MNDRLPILSVSAVSVLAAIDSGHRYGFDIMDVTGLPSGTVYPILGRLTKAGLVEAKWERSVVARREKRPARKYYLVTDSGTASLLQSVQHYQTVGGRMVSGRAALKPAEARSQ